MDQGVRNGTRQVTAGGTNVPSLMSVCRRAAGDLWRTLPDVVLFELVFQAISFVILSPLFAWLFARFVATSGREAIGNFDIARFLLTPVGLALGTAILTLAIGLTCANIAGLLYIAYGAGQDRRVSYFEALRLVATRAARLLGASFLVLLLLVAVLAPFVAIAGLIAWNLLTEHDINYYLELRPPEFNRALVWGGVLAVLATVSLLLVAGLLVFVLPEALLNHGRLRATIPGSVRLARGSLGRVFLLLVGWILAWELAAVLLNGGIYWLGRTLVRNAGDRLGILLTVLGSLTAASILLNFALALAAVAIGCELLAQLYLIARRQRAESPALDTLPALDARPRWSVPRRAPIALALVAIGLATAVVYQVLSQVRWDDRVEISAHRGASLTKTENTASAVRRAVEDGATYVEIDVQLTTDGRVVLVHDADLMRLAGSPLVVNRSKYDELRAIEFNGEHVPTLEETIDIVRGKAKLIVELKTYGSDPAPLIDAVVRILRDQQMLDQAVVMSLEYDEAVATKKVEPKLPVGFVTSATLGDLSRLSVDFLAVSRSQATNTLIAAAHAQDKQIFVWTIDDRPGMASMIDRGVDNIITNDPAQLVDVLRERRDLEPSQRLLLRFRSLYID